MKKIASILALVFALALTVDAAAVKITPFNLLLNASSTNTYNLPGATANTNYTNAVLITVPDARFVTLGCTAVVGGTNNPATNNVTVTVTYASSYDGAAWTLAYTNQSLTISNGVLTSVSPSSITLDLQSVPYLAVQTTTATYSGVTNTIPITVKLKAVRKEGI